MKTILAYGEQEAELYIDGSQGKLHNGFGRAVAIDGERIAAGAFPRTSNTPVAVFIF
ncbi:MAG: hypothetical protein R2865_05745 [Deinococcales bacterium]